MEPSIKKKRKTVDQSFVPPHDEVLERTIIGTLFVQSQLAKKYALMIPIEAFYKESHRAIWKAIIELTKEGLTCNAINVIIHLTKVGELDKTGGAAEISQMVEYADIGLERISLILLEYYYKREAATRSAQFYAEFMDEKNDIFDLVDSAKEYFTNLIKISVQKSKSNKKYEAEIISKLDSPSTMGMRTGLILLDFLLGGFNKTDLIIIAARPGVGKTALALKFLRKSKSLGKKVGIYTFEMTGTQLVVRILSADLKINSQKFRSNKFTEEEKEKIKAGIAMTKDDYIINDTVPNIDELCSIIENDVINLGIESAIVDYIQIVPPSNPKLIREQQVSDITRKLKLTAKKLDIPILALSQLKRQDVREDKDKDPELSDLRESGAIEQDADIVLFIKRIGEKATIIIAKNRHGDLAKVPIKYIKAFTEFVDDEDESRTRKALIYYEKFNEITPDFEEKLKISDKIEIEKIVNPFNTNNNEQSEQSDEQSLITPF